MLINNLHRESINGILAMYERLEVASVKKILIFSKHLYCNRFLRQSQTETTRPTKNHFLVGLFFVILVLYHHQPSYTPSL